MALLIILKFDNSTEPGAAQTNNWWTALFAKLYINYFCLAPYKGATSNSRKYEKNMSWSCYSFSKMFCLMVSFAEGVCLLAVFLCSVSLAAWGFFSCNECLQSMKYACNTRVCVQVTEMHLGLVWGLQVLLFLGQVASLQCVLGDVCFSDSIYSILL